MIPPRRGRHRNRASFTADDWPFSRPGVNPVATSSPANLEPAATEYLAARAVECLARPRGPLSAARKDGLGECRVVLEIVLAAAGRNKWHRSGDHLVGLWDVNGYSRLETVLASTQLVIPRERGPP